MIITNNIPALQAATNLGKTNTQLAKSMNNLSIGTRINSAKDDAAGLAITNKLKNQIRGLNTASQNAMDGMSLIQTAEGALSEVTNMLQRMREMSVQAANDTNTPEDRELIAIEYENLREELTKTAERTEFNKIKILSGELYKYQDGDELIWAMPEYAANGTPPMTTQEYLQQFQNDLTMQVGANMSMEFDFSIPKITASTLGLRPWPAVELANGNWVTPNSPYAPPGTPIDYSYQFGHERAVENLEEVDRAVNIVSSVRAHLGAAANRLDHTVMSLDTTAQNTERARSRIEDTDMAYESTVYATRNIIAQGAISIIAQANQRPQSILQLM